MMMLPACPQLYSFSLLSLQEKKSLFSVIENDLYAEASVGRRERKKHVHKIITKSQPMKFLALISNNTKKNANESTKMRATTTSADQIKM